MNKDCSNNPLSGNLIDLLSNDENQLFQKIVSVFREISKFSEDDIYMYIKSLCLFCTFKSQGPDLKKSMLVGLVASRNVVQYKTNHGFVIAFNSNILSSLIQKSRNFLSNHLSKSNILEKISEEIIHIIISQNSSFESHATQILATCQLLEKYGISTDFYFLKRKYIHYDNTLINDLISELSEKIDLTKNTNKKFPNNEKFLEKYRKNQHLQKVAYDSQMEAISLRKQLDIFFTTHFTTETNQANNEISNERLKKKIYDLFYHRPKTFWDEGILKAAFLIKYCSDSSYNRLWALSKNLLPPPTTIESHFSKDVQDIHQILIDSSKISILLDSYWKSNKHKIIQNAKQQSKNFEIQCCISCDAASLINFDENYDDETEYEEEEEEFLENDEKNKILNEKQKILNEKKKILREKKNIIEQIINGSSGQLIQVNEILKDEEANFFFALLLQPFDWRLPVMVVQLIKSTTGHQTLNEFYIIKNILSIINNHKHFSVHFFAADGEVALNMLHQEAFNKYESYIGKVLKGELTMDSFIQKVYELCIIIPVLDMLHAVKSGRNKIMIGDIKLGDGCDIFNSQSLSDDLNIKSNVLKDKSTAGRMKDMYALILFELKNVLTEFEKNKNSSGFYLLIYSIIIEIFRNNYLHLDLRIMLSDFCLYILLLLYNSSSKLPKQTKYRKNSRSKAKYIWFNDKIGIIKLINTMIALGYCLRDPKINKYFGIERLSSRDCESYFGQFRNHFCGNESAITAFSFAVRSALSLRFQFDLGVYFSISKRDNFGGCHLGFVDRNSSYFFNQNISTNFSLDDIRKIAHNIFNIGTKRSTLWSEESQEFISELSTLIQNFPSLRNKKISLRKGRKILPKIIAAQSQKKTIHQSHVIYPSLPKSDVVISEIKKIEQQILKLNGELRILTNEKNKIDNKSRISPEECSIQKQIVERNKQITRSSHDIHTLKNDTMLLSISTLPYYQKQIHQNEQFLIPMFKWNIKWKIELNEKAKKLTQQYIELLSSCKNNSFNYSYKNTNDSMFLDQISKNQNVFYDMNNFISDPITAYQNYKNRTAWSDKEIQIFIECYSKNPKNFRQIAKVLKTKSVKSIIEFYYNNKNNLNLKKYEVWAKKKGKMNLK